MKRTDNYVFMKKTLRGLDIAYNTNKNIILWGPGGMGKSTYSVDFLLDKGITPYVLTFGSGTTTDRLFGGTKTDVFLDTGKIEYFVENSFMNHEYVIFEELFDARSFILEELKDILSSGFFRKGGQLFEVKTKLIICCTNKSRADFVKDSSTRALMERFPLDMEVKWENYDAKSYKTLFESRFGEDNNLLSYVFEKFGSEKIIVSPRIAIDVYEAYAQEGEDSLNYFAVLKENKALLTKTISEFNALSQFNALIEELEKNITILIETEDEALAIKMLNDLDSLDKLKLSDAHMPHRDRFKYEFKSKIEKQISELRSKKEIDNELLSETNI